MLKIENILVNYGEIKAIKGVSLKVNQGEVVTILGPNGAGKSTLLNTVSGIYRASGGTLTYFGTDIANVNPEDIVKMGIIQVPEGRAILYRMTVKENLELGAYTRKDVKEIRFDLERMLDAFPVLRDKASQMGGNLSGGEQQMLAIARALMGRPKLLLMDEPSMGLAPLLVNEIFRIIRKISQQGTTVLLVEQNARMSLKYADRAYILNLGKITLEGNAQDLLNDPTVTAAYLGVNAKR